MAEPRTRLSWIDTTGGPHLVLPEKYGAAWEGGYLPSAGRIVQANFRCNPNEPATDYDRACSVKGWLGSISAGDGHALVLTGDRLSAAYYNSANGRQFILRWVYAPSETALLDRLHHVRDQLLIEETTEFQHPGGTLFLMDSVDVAEKWASQHTRFILPRATYRVTTTQTKTEDIHLLIHEFQRAGNDLNTAL